MDECEHLAAQNVTDVLPLASRRAEDVFGQEVYPYCRTPGRDRCPGGKQERQCYSLMATIKKALEGLVSIAEMEVAEGGETVARRRRRDSSVQGRYRRLGYSTVYRIIVAPTLLRLAGGNVLG